MKQTKIADHQICCGCSACEQTCPQHCISMQADAEGFLYPSVDGAKCIDCGLCKKVCPALTPYPEQQPSSAYAVVNKDVDIRLRSSSGGVFSLLAEKCLSQGGTIYGACFSPAWKVVHKGTNRIEDVPKYRGSKYVQSEIGHCYMEVKELLERNKTVMFVGTPCQIAGLHHFLGKTDDNLLTVDFICHGVPSPAIWNWYINDFANKTIHKNWLSRLLYRKNPLKVIRNVQFRYKENGWKQYSILIETCCLRGKKYQEIYFKNPYMRAFLTNLCLRPSCHNCLNKEGKSHSDLTIADFWNVHKVVDGFDDDKGTSLVLINTKKGEDIFNSLECRRKEVKFLDAIQYNPSWSKSYEENERRTEFMDNYSTRFADFI